MKHEKEVSESIIESYDKVYKPERTLEFLRKGNLVLYSAQPLNNIKFIFKWPFIQIDSLTAFLTLNYWTNWFSLSY